MVELLIGWVLCLFGWLVGLLVCWFGWSVGLFIWLVGRLFRWFVSLVAWLVINSGCHWVSDNAVTAHSGLLVCVCVCVCVCVRARARMCMFFESRQGQVIFVSIRTPRAAIGHPNYPVQWVTGFFPQAESCRGLKLTTQVHCRDQE